MPWEYLVSGNDLSDGVANAGCVGGARHRALQSFHRVANGLERVAHGGKVQHRRRALRDNLFRQGGLVGHQEQRHVVHLDVASLNLAVPLVRYL